MLKLTPEPEPGLKIRVSFSIRLHDPRLHPGGCLLHQDEAGGALRIDVSAGALPSPHLYLDRCEPMGASGLICYTHPKALH